MKRFIGGFDIGGTKCATVLAEVSEDKVSFLSRIEIKTSEDPMETFDAMSLNFKKQVKDASLPMEQIEGIGVSCGSPQDSEKGIIQAPPNLPTWIDFHIVDLIKEKLGLPSYIMNDADACALAEYEFGAGRGCHNVVFLTFGTGLGSGLILNDRLYSGPSGNAGEVGHIRLTNGGPIGCNKKGSFEGYCSGAGIARQANSYFERQRKRGKKIPEYAKEPVTAKVLNEQAQKGDKVALFIWRRVGRMFGKGLSVIVDMLNPDVIIAGGVYMRAHQFIDPEMHRIMKKECLPKSYEHVRVVPSQLGERIGDYGAILVYLYNAETK